MDSSPLPKKGLFDQAFHFFYCQIILGVTKDKHCLILAQ